MFEQLKKIDLKDSVTRYTAVNAAIIAVAVVLLCVFAFFTLRIVALNEEIYDARNKSKRLQSELSYYNLAKKLVTEDVEEYNSLLRRLIPEREDYFAIIASLESLSIYTGIDVSRYSIELPPQGSSKYSLSILGTIPVELLPVFLENYQYGTGRLVTVESMSYRDAAENNVRIQLNMYNRDVETSNVTRVGSLTEEDMELIRDIQVKIKRGEEIAGQVQEYKRKLEELKRMQLEREREAAMRTPTPSPRPRRPT